jgi:hypothetical protein
MAWKDKPGRKPLVMQGARQVGKTRLMLKKEPWRSSMFFRNSKF